MTISVEKEFERVKETIHTIVLSPKLKSYLIGVSKDDLKWKVKSYLRPKIGFSHFAGLSFSFKGRDILDLEKKLFEYCTSKTSHVLYKKYHKEKRNGGHKASLGGKSLDTKEKFHLYITWW